MSGTGLRQKAEPPRSVLAADLARAATAFLKRWSTETYLPNCIEVGDRHLSLADSFCVLANVLAEQHQTGKRPASVRIAPVFGPLGTTEEARTRRRQSECAIQVQMTNMFSSAGLVYPRMRLPEDEGGTWTFRPAALNRDPVAVLNRHR